MITVVIDEAGNATTKVTGCRCREEAAIAAEFKKCFAITETADARAAGPPYQLD